ncbi:hypothetical protein ACFQ1I_39340 [Kitasatospora arboriphila]
MSENPQQPPLRVVLTDINSTVVESWRAAFADTPEIEIHRGSILDEHVDAWVTPTNSRGRMDGGVDAVIKRHLGAASNCASSGRSGTGSPCRCRSAAPSASPPARSTPGS